MTSVVSPLETSGVSYLSWRCKMWSRGSNYHAEIIAATPVQASITCQEPQTGNRNFLFHHPFHIPLTFWLVPLVDGILCCNDACSHFHKIKFFMVLSLLDYCHFSSIVNPCLPERVPFAPTVYQQPDFPLVIWSITPVRSTFSTC